MSISFDNPVNETFEVIDAYLCRRISMYSRYFKCTNSLYYAGKVQVLTDIARLVIASENVQVALDAVDDIAHCANTLHNDFNYGMADAVRQFKQRITRINHDMTQISFEEYRQILTEHYNVEYYDINGDFFVSAEFYSNRRDAIEEIIRSMYGSGNLDVSHLFHFDKALLVHVCGGSECIELRHHFIDGVCELLDEIK